MPPAASCPPALRRQVFRGTAAVRQGLLTREQLRSSPWQRLFTDVYAGPDVDVCHRVRAIAAARVLLPGAVVSGPSAAVLWGVDDLVSLPGDVEITLPPGHRRVDVTGLRARRRLLDPVDTDTRSGVRVTSPTRTVLDLAAVADHESAVVAVDQFTNRWPPALHRAREAASVATGRDCRRVRAVLAASDGLAESPQETRLRLLIASSGLPMPVAQHKVLDGGREVARVDFAWVALRLALEYDGVWHATPGRFPQDRARLNRLTAAGWRVLFVTAADLHSPATLLGRIEAELARRPPNGG